MPTTDGHFPGHFIASPSLSVKKGHRLPQWSMDGGIYHVSFRLADSIPAFALARWMGIRQELQEVRETRGLTEDELALYKAAYEENIEQYLNAGHGACLLRSEDALRELSAVIEHGNGIDYTLHVACIMPNHVHVVVEVDKGEDFKALAETWKRVSSHKLNRLLGRKGSLWMQESYTRIIRTAEEYTRQVSYVLANPETAGLTSGFWVKAYK